MPIDPEREEGIRRVIAHTPKSWARAFDRGLRYWARTGEEFSVYDVLDLDGVGLPPKRVHPSAIGARMRIASRKGIIQKVGFVERETHGDVVLTWTGRRVDA